MSSYLIAICAVVGLMVFWTLVQILWMRTFPEYRSDVDALALRKECHSCKDEGNCNTKLEACDHSAIEV